MMVVRESVGAWWWWMVNQSMRWLRERGALRCVEAFVAWRRRVTLVSGGLVAWRSSELVVSVRSMVVVRWRWWRGGLVAAWWLVGGCCVLVSGDWWWWWRWWRWW